MSGADLGSPEFAYLLAALHAREVIGLHAPDLFPDGAKAQDKLYRQGRADLESNGWLKPLADHDGEYELNPALFELAAVVAAPEYVVISTRTSDAGEKEMALHYLLGDDIAELAALGKGRYRLGVVPDRKSLFKRLADMVGAANSKPAVRFDLPRKTFAKIRSAVGKNGAEKAEALLIEASPAAAKGTSILPAAADEPKCELVLLQVKEGKVQDGRRMVVLGEGKRAWLAHRPQQDSNTLTFRNGDAGSMGSLLEEWIGELAS